MRRETMELELEHKIKTITKGKHYFSQSTIDKIDKCPYKKQAVDFLYETGTTCEIVKIGLDYSKWNKDTPVNKYSVTLSNKKHTYIFDFWDSIHNTEKNESLRFDFYSVLACLDVNYDMDFDDFCSTYGYTFSTERDFIKVKEIYFAVKDQEKNLRRLFTSEELERLSEIN